SLVIVAFNPTIFAEVDRWMKLLDVPPEEGAGRSVHVYAVENAKAADLAEILSELYGAGQSGSRTGQQQGFTPFGTRQRGGATTQPGGRVGGGNRAGGNPAAPVVAPAGAPRVNQMLDDFDDYAPLQQFDDSGGLGSSSGSSSSN